MAVKISSNYLSELTVVNTHEPSKTEITTTAPLDNGGKGNLFSPTDLFATSLICCALTVMAIKANTEGISFDKARASVEKHMVSEPRKVKKLVTRFTLSSEHNKYERKILEQTARNCPVVLSLHPDIEVVFQFDYS
jgi:putative redox protein